MAEVFAGFLAGYVLALITTPLLALGLLKLRAGSSFVSRLFPRDANLVAVSLILHGAMAMFLTGLGIFLGLVLLAMKDAGGAWGSLNGPFTLFVAALTLAIFAPFIALLKPLRPHLISYAVVVLLVFGWLTPYLAHWSQV